MRELFQLYDYIRINSSDFKNEIIIQNLRFEKPSYDFRYWERNIKSKDAETFTKWFEGKPIRVDSNEFTVEFPKELADNGDEKIRLYEYIFGDEGIKNHVLPLPKDIYGLIEIDVQIVPGSATYNFKGRTIVMHFSTLITIKGNYVPKIRHDMKLGIPCNTSRDLNSFFAIYQVLNNPDGVEFFDGERGLYVIEKSMDENICRRKFRLMYESALETTLPNMLHSICVFAPGYAPKNARDFIGKKACSIYGFVDNNSRFEGFNYLGYSRPRHTFFKTEPNSYFNFKVDSQAFSAQSYANSLKKLGMNFDKCESEVAKVINENKGPIKKKISALGISFEAGVLKENRNILFGDENCFAMVLLSKNDFSYSCKALLNEIHAMNQIVHSVQQFLENEIIPTAGNHSYYLLNYAYQKVTLDPILYADEASGIFSNYAKMII